MPALHEDEIAADESRAEQLVKTWLSKYQKSIPKLPYAKKALYEPVQRETRTPELYPDFVMVHQTDEGIRPSIIDPHGRTSTTRRAS